MPVGKEWRSLVSEPLTRYQVRPVPAVLLVALVGWLVVAALVAGHWLAGVGALAVAVAWGYGWLTLRRRRLQRAMVLPPSARSERRAALRDEQAVEDGSDGQPPSD
jgi:O-antigen/teichoic acid export membrane protein